MGCALLEDEGETLRARWARTEADVPAIRVGYSAPMAGSSLQGVMRSGRPRIINDLLDYAHTRRNSDATRRILDEGVRSSLTCPLLVQGRAVGFLFFSSRRVGAYDAAHADTFVRLASLISGVVEKSALFERLEESNAALGSPWGQTPFMIRSCHFLPTSSS